MYVWDFYQFSDPTLGSNFLGRYVENPQTCLISSMSSSLAPLDDVADAIDAADESDDAPVVDDADDDDSPLIRALRKLEEERALEPQSEESSPADFLRGNSASLKVLNTVCILQKWSIVGQ